MSDDALILKAALCPAGEALEAWQALLNNGEFDSLDGKMYRALPTVYTNLRTLEADVPWLSQLKGTARHLLVQNISRQHAMMPLLQAIEAENIDYRLLKGAAIASLTNAWSMRVMGDIDILFHKKDVENVLSILKRLGARQKFNLAEGVAPSLHETWILSTHTYATDLDIHVAHTTDKTIFGRMLAAEPRIVKSQGLAIKTPTPEWLLIHSTVHGQLGKSRSDSLQSALDAARLLPLINLSILEKNASQIGVLDILEQTLRELPNAPTEITNFIHKIRALNLRSSKRRKVSKLMSRKLFNWYNIKKFLGRRTNAQLMKQAKTETKGRRLLYWAWLKTGQLNAFEQFCIDKFGGFLNLPPDAIKANETLTIVPSAKLPADTRLTEGSIMGHDFRVKIRLPEGIKQAKVCFEYKFSAATYLGLYINATPLGVLPLPDAQPGIFPIVADDGALEISLRSPCNSDENAIDFMNIRCEW